MKMIIAALAISASLAGCGAHYPDIDSGWRQDDAYGTGQRGRAPNGGRGTFLQKDTRPAPITPGGGDGNSDGSGA